MSAHLAESQLSLQVTPEARAWLATTGYDPSFGARPLRRLIQREIGDQLAEMLLAGQVPRGSEVLVDVRGNLGFNGRYSLELRVTPRG